MHEQLTKIYNDLENATLPASVLKFPSFFVIPDELMISNSINATKAQGATFQIMLELTNITRESMRNYHFLWWIYNNKRENLTLYCKYIDSKDNCSDIDGYSIADSDYSCLFQ